MVAINPKVRHGWFGPAPRQQIQHPHAHDICLSRRVTVPAHRINQGRGQINQTNQINQINQIKTIELCVSLDHPRHRIQESKQHQHVNVRGRIQTTHHHHTGGGSFLQNVVSIQGHAGQILIHVVQQFRRMPVESSRTFPKGVDFLNGVMHAIDGIGQKQDFVRTQFFLVVLLLQLDPPVHQHVHIVFRRFKRRGPF